MKKLLILLPLIIIFFSACDLLNHDTYSDSAVENFFADFSAAVENASADNLSEVMAFYHEDYSNNLMDKSAMESFYAEFFSIYTEVSMQAELVDYNRFDQIEWQLLVTAADTTYSLEMDDVLSDSEPMLFYGNQIDPPALDPDKPVVFAEMLTAENCGNCPEIAEYLHQMKNIYGEQFIYVEYCLSNNHTPFYLEYASYYSAFSQPTTIIGGNNIVTGGDTNALDDYYHSIVESELQARLNILAAELNSGVAQVSLELELLNNLSTEDLTLTAVVADGKPEIYYTSDSQQFHNVAYAKTEIEISASGTLDLTVEYDENIDFIQPKIIVWLQTKTPIFDNEISKTYTAAEYILGE
ncbi:MAG: hypothetical protein R6U84_09160 [Candidatus Cloacimonadales bacterium]